MTRTSTTTTRTRAHAHTKRPHARATQGRMPARTCARALTQKRAEEISAPHSRPRTAITHTPQNAHGITTALSKQANGHRRPASDHTPHARHRARPGAPAISPPHRTRVNCETHSPRAQPSHPCTRGTSVRPPGRLPSAGQRTHTLARIRAGRRRTHASARLCAHLSRWCWIRRAARWRGGGHGGATRGRRAQQTRIGHQSSRAATKHATCVCVVGFPR